MHFGPSLTYLDSLKGWVPEKAKLRTTYVIKKIPLIFETPPEFMICFRGSSTV